MDKWQDVIFACDKCKLRYPASAKGICPVHKTELVVAFAPGVIPEKVGFKACPDCGSESTKALKSDRGKIGYLETEVPHCPDCGSTTDALLVGMRELTDDEVAVLSERQKQRQKIYKRVSEYPAAKGK